MARTKRTIPYQGKYRKWLRTPHYKHKLLAGEGRKQVVTDYDDQPIAALAEIPRRQAFV